MVKLTLRLAKEIMINNKSWKQFCILQSKNIYQRLNLCLTYPGLVKLTIIPTKEIELNFLSKNEFMHKIAIHPNHILLIILFVQEYSFT